MKKLKVLLIMAVMSTSIMACGSKEADKDLNAEINKSMSSEENDDKEASEDNGSIEGEESEENDIETEIEEDDDEIELDDSNEEDEYVDQLIYDFDNAEASIYVSDTFVSFCNNSCYGFEAGESYDLPNFNDAIINSSDVLENCMLSSFGIFKINNLASDMNGYCFEYDFINEKDEGIEVFLIGHVDQGELYLDMAVENNDIQHFDMNKNGVLFLTVKDENNNDRDEIYVPNDGYEYEFVYSYQIAFAGSSFYEFDDKDNYTDKNAASSVIKDFNSLNDEDACIEQYFINGVYLYEYYYGNDESEDKILELADKYGLEFTSYDEIYDLQNEILKTNNLDMDKINENFFTYDNYIIYRDLAE